MFASPFFEAALNGDWSETRVDDQSILSRRRHSISSVITIPQPPTNPSDRASREIPTNVAPSTSLGSDIASSPEGTGPAAVSAKKTEEDTDVEDLGNDTDGYVDDMGEKEDKEDSSGPSDAEERDKVRDTSLCQLEGRGFGGSQRTLPYVKTRSSAIAKIVLMEEKAGVFHDFLKFVYPQYVGPILLHYIP